MARQKFRISCHICCLPIDERLVDYNHPLYGTRDHVIPRARGGKTDRENIKPAHRMCNITKGCRGMVPPKERKQLARKVFEEMSMTSMKLDRHWLAKALSEIQDSIGDFYAHVRMRMHQKTRPLQTEVHRWEDDGGMCY
jgi:hypothetical protein